MTYNLDHLASLIEREDTIVFVGSGVSAWSGLPTWRSLLEQLSEFLLSIGRSAALVEREIANNDLLLAASYGFDKLTPHERCEFLRRSLRIPSAVPSPLHRALADLGTHCFITTNYDGLLERVLRETRPDEVFDVITPLQMVEISSIVQARAKGFVFKPHGDIGSCDSIVLTREDYRRLYGDKRNVLEAMRTLLVSRPVIFVGYGLRDPDFLLIQDLIASTFGVNPPDHYALMADVISEEIDYWRRSYGINLISYSTNERSGPQTHSALLEMLEDIRSRAGRQIEREAYHSKSNQILALARHSRRLQSAIPVAHDMMPVRLEQNPRRTADRLKNMLRIGRDARRFLATSKDKLILEGPPGAGKTFLLEQTVRDLASDLEQACLADQMPDIKSLRVPMIIYLRDYHGDISAMLAEALPLDIRLEDLLKEGAGAFFFDGYNEAPIADSETNRLMDDLIAFIGGAGQCGVVITTRFGDELTDLALPIAMLDEISPEYVEQELVQAGISQEDLDPVTLELLNRPLFHRAWKDGSLSLNRVRTVHDVYTQLIQKMEQDARENFDVSIAFGPVFERIAYSMVDSGQLSMPAAEVHTNLRAALDDSVDARDFVNFAISTGTLLPTSTKRIAFFHHSVAEYFAAQYLAKMVLSDNGALLHCLGRHDWDQALLLTLGFLPDDKATAVFEEILRADRAMALRALNYVEYHHFRWTQIALESLIRLGPDENAGRSAEYALTRLRLTESSLPMLLRLAEYDTSLGGTAAGLIWSITDEHKQWVLDRLVDMTRGYNFKARMADMVKKNFDLSYTLSLVERVRRLHLDDDVAARLLRGEEIHEYVGLISAVADILRNVPTGSLIGYAEEDPSPLLELVICGALDYVRTPEALAFVEKCIVKKHDHAIVHLYFQLKFGQRNGSEPPKPRADLLNALLAAMREGREGDWAFGDICLFATEIPDFRSRVSALIGEEEGIMAALLAYAVGADDLFFDTLERDSQNSTEWSHTHAIAALRMVDVSWRGHEQLFINLLQNKNISLATPLLESAGGRAAIGEDWTIECTIPDLAWWISWLEEEREDRIFCSRIGSFLANATDRATRMALIARFNENRVERRILDEYVLSSMSGLSMDAFTTEAVEWFVGQLNARQYYPWAPPLIGKIATETFVQERLLPLLLEDPPQPLRRNLLLSLRDTGRLHRRRYVGDDDQLLA